MTIPAETLNNLWLPDADVPAICCPKNSKGDRTEETTHRNRLEICRFSIFLEVDSQLRMEAVAHSQLAFVYHPGNPYLCAQIYNYAQINDGIIH